jgi:hypothetical protein
MQKNDSAAFREKGGDYYIAGYTQGSNITA